MEEQGAGERFARSLGRDWRRWQRLNQLPALAIPVPAALNADRQLVTGAGIWTGFSLREVSGAVVTIQFFDGSDATGRLLLEQGYAATATGQVSLPFGLRFRSGLWLHFVVATGGLRGAVYARLMSELEYDAELD